MFSITYAQTHVKQRNKTGNLYTKYCQAYRWLQNLVPGLATAAAAAAAADDDDGEE